MKIERTVFEKESLKRIILIQEGCMKETRFTVTEGSDVVNVYIRFCDEVGFASISFNQLKEAFEELNGGIKEQQNWL
jgi:hypothetical protein